LASAWPRSLTEPSIDRQLQLRKRPRRVKSQAKSTRRVSTQRPDERILTDRLDLRPVTVNDAEEMAAIFADRRLYTFTGGTPSTLEALCSTFVRLEAARTASATAQLNWVVRHRVEDKGHRDAAGHLRQWRPGGRDRMGSRRGLARAGAGHGGNSGRGRLAGRSWRPHHHGLDSTRPPSLDSGALRAGLRSTSQYRDTELHREQLWRRRMHNLSSA
jgi:RimJ/RimL family protein N-acetyltransferase